MIKNSDQEGWSIKVKTYASQLLNFSGGSMKQWYTSSDEKLFKGLIHLLFITQMIKRENSTFILHLRLYFLWKASMDFGDNRLLVQANIKENLVLTGLGSVEHWIHVRRYIEQYVNEPKFWHIIWAAGNYPGYQVHKKMRYDWSFFERAISQNTSWDCSQ